MPWITLPHLHWRGVTSWMRFTAALLFVCVSFLIPQRFVKMHETRPLDIREEADKLAEGIDVLKEEEIIELEQAETLEEKLAQLQADASGEDPVKTWEALDHLANTLSQESTDTAQGALSETERLTEAETLSEGLIHEASEMNTALLTESMATLAGLIQKAAQENELLAEHLANLAKNASDIASFTPEQLREISAVLRFAKQNIMDRLARLRDVKLIDMKTLKACEGIGQCNSAGLAAFLNENSGNSSVSALVASWCRGGVTSGRGDAPMTWSDGTTEEGAEFQAETLPLSDIAALKDSEMTAISMAAPSVEPSSLSSHVGGLSGAAAGGGSSFTQTVLPRHRGAVKRYFERP